MTVYLSGEKNKKFSEDFLHEKYIELKEFLERERAAELYWNGDAYNESSYTRIIQKLIDDYKHSPFRFIATTASTCRLGFTVHHCMQLSVYIRQDDDNEYNVVYTIT